MSRLPNFAGIQAAVAAGVQAGMRASATPSPTAQQSWAGMSGTERITHLGNEQFFIRQMMSQGTGAAGGFGLMGSLMSSPGRGMMMSGIGMGLDALSQSARSGAGTINLLRNSSMSDSQKAQAIGEGLPVVGDLIKSFRELRDAAHGVTERLRRSKEEHDVQMAVNPAYLSADFETDSARLRSSFARNRAGALGGLSSPAFGGGDRTTAAGERAYQDALRLVGSQDAARMAGAGAEAARRDASAAENRVSGIDSRIAGLNRRRSGLEGQREGLFGGWGGDSGQEAVGRTGNERALVEVNQQLEQLNSQRNAAVQESSQKGIQAIQAEQAAREANIGTMREELAILRERENRIAGNSTRIGGMSVIQRRIGLQGIRMLRERGPDHIPRHLLSAAQQFDPQTTQAILRNFGENTSEYQANAGEGGFGGDAERLADVQGRGDQLLNRIREQSLTNVQTGATQVADTLDKVITTIFATLQARIQALEGRIRATQNVAHATQGR